jgi:hypothetical protein
VFSVTIISRGLWPPFAEPMKLNFPGEVFYKINCTIIILTMTERGEEVSSKHHVFNLPSRS